MTAPPAFLVEPCVIDLKIGGVWTALGTTKAGVDLRIAGQSLSVIANEEGQTPKFDAFQGDNITLVAELETINYLTMLAALPGADVSGSGNDYDVYFDAMYPGADMSAKDYPLRLRPVIPGRTWGAYAARAHVASGADVSLSPLRQKTMRITWELRRNESESDAKETLFRMSSDSSNITGFA